MLLYAFFKNSHSNLRNCTLKLPSGSKFGRKPITEILKNKRNKHRIEMKINIAMKKYVFQSKAPDLAFNSFR